jgi:hypothetical protein
MGFLGDRCRRAEAHRADSTLCNYLVIVHFSAEMIFFRGDTVKILE